ncbi:type II toxin-antitoxin system RelE/ParE family toxin [Streptomyces triticagri]|uniref:Type II toxin-antitoxin system RelE/ParE family toxin n=1 Tax=Streptomyces triticagri TaxID=2293568 RepID=A0A372M7P4_9ACTN|nr:type II toxin-antitoxin system RelE/ParE family toxin [Streptomyces triticagri]RFU86964.1 type II toxin-antitoxin system RelE/ParE family toxin [Streptomyces triticagri]
MTWSVTVEPDAVNEMAGFLKDDPASVRELVAVIDSLAHGPSVAGSQAWGVEYRRLHRGRWRVLYHVDDAARVIRVEHVGRATP